MGHDAAQWVGRGKKLPMSHETLETRRDLFWRRAQGAYRHMFSGIDVGGFKEYDDSKVSTKRDCPESGAPRKNTVDGSLMVHIYWYIGAQGYACNAICCQSSPGCLLNNHLVFLCPEGFQRLHVFPQVKAERSPPDHNPKKET